MNDFLGKTVTVMGLGQFEQGSGIAAVRFLIDKGANLIITDLKTEAQLAEQVQRVKDYAQEKNYHGSITWVMGKHREEDMVNVDMVVRNPGVPIKSPLLEKARAAGIPVESEMSLFFKLCAAPIIGITGTRGKSTTTSLISHILSGTNKKVWTGGNILQSLLNVAVDIQKDDYVVVELSSWMLESLAESKLSPHLAVLLNVLPDHLNVYGSMDDYAHAKSLITSYQTDKDILICNQDNSYTQEIGAKTKAKVTWFTTKEKALNKPYFAINGFFVVSDEAPEKHLLDLRMSPLRGEHNYYNVLAALAAVKSLGINDDIIQSRISTFASLPGRIQFIDEIKGVTFVNDTTSTTPVATVAALNALQDRDLVLIAGGADKKLDFAELAQVLPRLVKSIVWLPGEGTNRLKAALGVSIDALVQADASDMDEAVKQAFAIAVKGDLILLSPACASFGLFKNEFDRGEKFNQAVAYLKQIQINA